MIFPENELAKILLECWALSILGGLARLFLIEKTVSGGWRQFFGGMVFGILVGYLFSLTAKDHVYYSLTGKIWRVWSVGCAIFGKEILYVCKKGIIEALPVVTTFLINQGKRISSAWEAYKKSDNEN